MKIKFESILNSEVFKKKAIKLAVVARSNGKIEYISKKWKLNPSDIKKCISSWQSQAPSVTLEGTKYSCLRNEPEFFSGLNYKKKEYLIGAVTPDVNDQYFILGYAPPKSNAGNAYVDVVRAANKMKKSGTYIDPSTQFGKFSKDEIAKDVKAKKKGKIKGKKKDKNEKKQLIKDEPLRIPITNNPNSVSEKAALIQHKLSNRGATLNRSTINRNSNSNQTISPSQNSFIQKQLPTIDPQLKGEINGFLQWIKDPEGLAGYIQYYLDNYNPNVIKKMAEAYKDFSRVFNF